MLDSEFISDITILWLKWPNEIRIAIWAIFNGIILSNMKFLTFQFIVLIQDHSGEWSALEISDQSVWIIVIVQIQFNSPSICL